MARKAKTNSGTFNKELLIDIVRRDDDIADELATLKGKFMSDCKALASDRKDLFKEAKDRGLNAKILRKNIKARDLRRSADALRDALEPDYHADFDQMAAVIEVNVISGAAKARAANNAANSSSIDDFEG